MNTYQARRERGALILAWGDAGLKLVDMRREARARGWSTYTKDRIRAVLAAERRQRERADG